MKRFLLLKEAGNEAVAVYCDVTTLESVQEAVATALTHFEYN